MSRFSSLLVAGLVISMMALASVVMVQTAAKPTKVLTPQQRQYQAQLAQWRAEREALRVKATNALDVEMERSAHRDCPKAVATRDAEICLDQAFKIADKNYAAFTSALRSMLALERPQIPGEKPASGPTGTPLTSAEEVAQFDQLESLSKKYREAAGSVAYDQFKGGTHAPVFALETQLKLLRLHLQELSFIYDGELTGR